MKNKKYTRIPAKFKHLPEKEIERRLGWLAHFKIDFTPATFSLADKWCVAIQNNKKVKTA